MLGALNGQNCLSEDVTTSELLTGIECLSYADTDASSVNLMINGMKCTIWKTFVLEPWAEEQFGVPYNQLYTKMNLQVEAYGLIYLKGLKIDIV